MKKTVFHFRLHFTIAVLFIVLIVVFGALLGWYNYQKTSQLLLAASDEVFNQISRELSLDYRGTYKPVAQTVNIIASSPVTTAGTLEERLEALPLFRAALLEESQLSGLEVGYANGDFFIVRPLHNVYMRSRFAAPESAAFVVDQVDTGVDGKRYLHRFWYTDDLDMIKASQPEVTNYDPRGRPWYKNALDASHEVGTDPYLFFFVQQVGFTVSCKSPGNGAVVAGDVTLIQLSKTVSGYQSTERSEIVLLRDDGKVVAYRDTDKLVKQHNGDDIQLADVTDLGSEVLAHAAANLRFEDAVVDFEFTGEEWLGAIRELSLPNKSGYFLLMLSPKKELLRQALKIQASAALITLLLTLLAVPVTWWLAKIVAAPLQDLAGEAERISRFDFTSPMKTKSLIKEVDDLGQAMAMMKTTISKFLTLINSLASEQDFDVLLQYITVETMKVSNADAACTYLVDEVSNALQPAILHDGSTDFEELSALPELPLAEEGIVQQALLSGEIKIFNLQQDVSRALTLIAEQLDISPATVIILPLQNRQKEGIGVLCLLYNAEQGISSGEDNEQLAFINALSGFAAVTLEGRKMLKMQKELLESFIKLLAGAIDSKSPYTGGHCQRVPVLTKLLAVKACESSTEAFADFSLDAEEWEALHIASWLHDCGKVTTPEYVVDKATKLETLYNRLHEIRMRFEVLKRDAHIHYWEQRAHGGNAADLDTQLAQQWQTLDEEFAFVAECNLGSEYMAQEKCERLEKIGARTWQRTFDDRLGLSWEELQRKERSPRPRLPVVENLLADKDDHLVIRGEKFQINKENDYGFILDVPEYLYNRGELYNLGIARGTLTVEERYQINDHIVQTIVMLKKLPYPKHLAAVPDIAGGHHEKIDGTGYPRRLTGDQLSLPAKMMVIADIFEALTASDRPYKKAKKLSEAVRIMSFMAKDNHIDRDLFHLFLTSEVYLEYACEYLLPEQVDEVDISTYMKE